MDMVARPDIELGGVSISLRFRFQVA